MALLTAPFPQSNQNIVQAALAQSQGDLMQAAQLQAQNSQFAQKLDVAAQQQAQEGITQAFDKAAQTMLNNAKLQMQRETNDANREINYLKLAMQQKQDEANQAYKENQANISQQRADEYTRHNTAMEARPVGGKAPTASEILAGIESGSPPETVQPEATGEVTPLQEAPPDPSLPLPVQPEGETQGPNTLVPDVITAPGMATTEPSVEPAAPATSPPAGTMPDWTKLGVPESAGLRAVQDLEAQLSSGGTIGEETTAAIALKYAGQTPAAVALRDSLNALTPSIKANLTAGETAKKDAAAAQKQETETKVKLQEKQTTLSTMLKGMTTEQNAKVAPWVNELIDSNKDFDLTAIKQRVEDSINPEKDTTRTQLAEITSIISDLDKQYEIAKQQLTSGEIDDEAFKPIRDKYAKDREAWAKKKTDLFDKTSGASKLSPPRNNYKPPYSALLAPPSAGADVYFR